MSVRINHLFITSCHQRLHPRGIQNKSLNSLQTILYIYSGFNGDPFSQLATSNKYPSIHSNSQMHNYKDYFILNIIGDLG